MSNRFDAEACLTVPDEACFNALMGAFKKTVIAVSVAGLFGALGTMDYEHALLMDALEKVERPLRATKRDKTLPLSHPLNYLAVVCQSDYGERPTCRYYSERPK